MKMDYSASNSASVGTPAITIPLHSNNIMASRYTGSQNVHKQGGQDGRPSGPPRLDSDAGTISASSLGSDWSSSPASLAQNAEPSGLRLQVAVTLPSAANQMSFEPSTPASHQRKDKHRASPDNLPPNDLPPLFVSAQSPLGPSMRSSSSYKSVNLTSHYNPESKEPARLITYTKHSQGFTWNDELFLPSYLLNRHRHRGHGSYSSRRRWGGDDDDDGIGEFEEEGERCPVTDIFVTDEEAAAMMP